MQVNDSHDTMTHPGSEEEIRSEILQIAPFLADDGRSDFRDFVERFVKVSFPAGPSIPSPPTTTAWG